MPDKPQTGGRPRLRARRLALLALMAAGMSAAKAVMAPLPNIEPVTLLVMLCALAFGPQAFYAVYTFVALEFLLYGFGMWSFAYLYVWTIPAVGAMLLWRPLPVALAVRAAVGGVRTAVRRAVRHPLSVCGRMGRRRLVLDRRHCL